MAQAVFDAVLHVNRPNKEQFDRILQAVASSYELPAPTTTAAAGGRALLQEQEPQQQKQQQQHQQQQQQQQQKKLKEKHAARMATIFGAELEDMRKNDAAFIGTPTQLTILRDSLSL